MKKKRSCFNVIVVILTLLNQGCATPIEVSVKDDLGNPVIGLKIKAEAVNSVYNYGLKLKGLNSRYENVIFNTDSDGKGRGEFFDYIECHDQEGLKSSVDVYLADESRYWPYTVQAVRENTLPFTPLRANMVLRRKIYPHRMNYGVMALKLSGGFPAWLPQDSPELKAIFLQKTEVGFDMVYGDFLPPLGKGTQADLFIQAEILPNEKYSGLESARFFLEESRQPDPGPKPAPRPPMTIRYTFRFAGEGNGVVLVPMPIKEMNIRGIMPGYLDGVPGYDKCIASMIPQEAPVGDYCSLIVRQREVIPKAEKPPRFSKPSDLDKYSWWVMRDGAHDMMRDAVYLFKIRAMSNGGYYGVIKSDFCIMRGGGAYFHYIINPDSGERNVEELADESMEKRELPLKINSK